MIGLEAALGEMRNLRAALERAAVATAPTKGWDRLEETEWPFLAHLFYADAAMRLAALPHIRSRREAMLAEARWAIDRSRAFGIPGAATTDGVALLPDGHLFVTLERFARLVRTDEHLDERRRLALGFERAFDRSPTAMLPSYASMWWTLDPAPALAGLTLHGRGDAAARKWERSVRTFAIDEGTGLIRAGFDGDHKRAIGPPRGCALMLAMPDLAIAAPALATEQWAFAKTHLVRTLGEVGVTGIREYPEPLDLPASTDSGRIIMGLGEAASGFGLAAAAAMGDLELLSRLLRSVRMVAPPAWEGDRLALRSVPAVGQAAILRAKAWSAEALEL